jgi:diaminohydroxyphosphoribosylaminopyrimidine deaminase/5-amino-6-(5-phosphoribosylamino)uracil reductase
MTQRGARQGFQAHLRSRGVEVVEFDFLTPDNVADYCYERGFLQVRSAVHRCWFTAVAQLNV